VVQVATADEVLGEALALPIHDRARVAAALLASLDEGEDTDADQAWAAEIERRAVGVFSARSHGSTWSDVRKRLTARLNRR
jgi:putative addiction module component (TIGR02574 family)